MTSLGAILTQQWVAGLQRQREDEIRREQLLRQDQQLAFSQMLQSQKSISDLVTAHQQRELQFATAMGEASQKSGIPMPELKSESANEHGLLGQMMGEASVKAQRTEQTQKLLFEQLKTGWEHGYKTVQQEDQQAHEMEKTHFVQGEENKRARDRNAARITASVRGAEVAATRAAQREEYMLTRKPKARITGVIDPSLAVAKSVAETFKPELLNPAVQQGIKAAGSYDKWIKTLGSQERAKYQDFITAYETMASRVGAFAHAYVRTETGQSRSDKEFDRLMEILPSMAINPTAFKARLQAYTDALNEERKIHEQTIAAGGEPAAMSPYTGRWSAEAQAELDALEAKGP